MNAHTVPAFLNHGPVTETDVQDADLHRVTDAALQINELERDDDPPYSEEVMEAYLRAKRATEPQNMRSRRIVRQQWQKREGNVDDAPELVGQTALFDFS